MKEEILHTLLPSVTVWLRHERMVHAAVLFGSAARPSSAESHIATPSDLDFHVIVKKPRDFEQINWRKSLPQAEICFQCARQATGGVRKLTIVFLAGQIDIIIVPVNIMRFAALGLRLGLHRWLPALREALAEMATCLNSGYKFIVGEKKWGHHYARVAALKGVRISDIQLREMAVAALCDLLWVLQKLESGECVAAQHLIHTRLVDTNLRIWRELQFRQKVKLESYGLGRGIGTHEGDCKRLLYADARVRPNELRKAALNCFLGLKYLLKEILPDWSEPPNFNRVVNSYLPEHLRLRAE